MSGMKTGRAKRALTIGVAAAALIAAPVVGGAFLGAGSPFGGQAMAQSQGGGQGGGGHGGSGGGQQGRGGSGGGHATGGSGASEGSSGQKGPSADSDAKGPKYQGGAQANKPGSGTSGTKPVWAQEGIPEVELGRLNVARAPTHVLDKAFTEAVSNFDSTNEATLYSMTAEAFATYVKANFSTVTRVDSPLENLALYKDLLANSGSTSLPGVTPASTLDLAAIFLGSASDKTVSITPDTVTAMDAIMKLPTLTPEQTATLAAKADVVRQAIAEGHGE